MHDAGSLVASNLGIDIGLSPDTFSVIDNHFNTQWIARSIMLDPEMVGPNT